MGLNVGLSEGNKVGAVVVGDNDGFVVGAGIGDEDGLVVGEFVGASVQK